MLASMLCIVLLFICNFHSVFAADCLTLHNYYRSFHNVTALRYDRAVENFAIKRATELAFTDIFKHAPNLPYGENLFYSTKITSCDVPVKLWYDEIKYYNWSNPRFSRATGHFTQIVWAGTTKLGCAAALSKTKKFYIVCNYDKPGNVKGYFKANVQPPIKRIQNG